MGVWTEPDVPLWRQLEWCWCRWHRYVCMRLHLHTGWRQRVVDVIVRRWALMPRRVRLYAFMNDGLHGPRLVQDGWRYRLYMLQLPFCQWLDGYWRDMERDWRREHASVLHQ
jgi:hypothetical protein